MRDTIKVAGTGGCVYGQTLVYVDSDDGWEICWAWRTVCWVGGRECRLSIDQNKLLALEDADSQLIIYKIEVCVLEQARLPCTSTRM